MADTPSGVAVDKPGNVYVSVRENGRGVIWKYTTDGTRSFFADIGQATIYGLAVTANGDVYAAMAAPDPREGSTGWTARGRPNGCREPSK